MTAHFNRKDTQAIHHSQDIGDDANGPHVTRFGILSIEYLRCHIVGGADLGLHHTPIGIVVPRQTEVDDLDRRILRLGLEEEIFWLQISVNDI